jgi:hypothetical protein
MKCPTHLAGLQFHLALEQTWAGSTGSIFMNYGGYRTSHMLAGHFLLFSALHFFLFQDQIKEAKKREKVRGKVTGFPAG